jgi:arginyl-tRNA synthetase
MFIRFLLMVESNEEKCQANRLGWFGLKQIAGYTHFFKFSTYSLIVGVLAKLLLQNLQETLKTKVIAAAKEQFGIELEHIAGEVPPKIELGDYAFPVAFELAKRTKQATGEKQNPRAIAEKLKEALEKTEDIARVEVAGAGYLNVYFDRAKFLAQLAFYEETTSTVSPHKRMVEHTSINPNKAAHIGHVRNSVLGDTFVRILRARGEQVEVQNYIDNTGVQVADVVVGFIHLEKMSLDDIKNLDASLPPDKPFDYYCWDLYTKVGLFYRDGDPNAEVNPEKKKIQQETIHAIEEGNNTTAEIAEYVAIRNVERILDTMERLGIRYDLLPRESEILKLHFWNHAFEKMKALGVIKFEEEGEHKGCWVMPLDSHTGTDEHKPDKILVRSNGTVTYTGKDIAYQMWKLGLLGLDFNYKLFRTYSDGHQVWITTIEPNEVPHPSFGNGTTVYNVIDTRQSYPQDVVKRGVAAIDPLHGEKASIHLSYEMVALSVATAEELGVQLSDEDRKRPFIEMSGRKGIGIKVDDFINRLQEKALHEVKSRHPELSEDEQLKSAHQITVGALRYFLLKFTRNTLIVFDFNEALSFEGETGPYCQYAAVRANSIFKKLDNEKQKSAFEIIRGDESKADITNIFSDEGGDEIWSLLMLASRLDEAIAQAAHSEEPANLAKYAFNLAKAFNLFYHRYKIISEENDVRRALLVTVADITLKKLTSALNTLGIEVPERM